MFCVMGMQFSSNEMKKRKEKYEDYNHETQNGYYTSQHENISSLDNDYHTLVYMIIEKILSVEFVDF